MILFKEKIFAGFVTGAAQPTPFYTLPEFDRLLGSANAFAIEVITSDITGSPTLTVELQTSNTGGFWLAVQSGVVNYSPSAAAPVGFGKYVGELGDRVRLATRLVGASTSANVLIVVTGHGQQN